MCFCIHSTLTPALPQRQPSLLTVSEMYLCVKGATLLNHLEICCLHPLFAKNPQNLPCNFHNFISATLQSLFPSSQTHRSQSVCFIVDLDPPRSTLARSSGPLFVCVYVIAWQGSAPSRLCEGLNVIHWAETVLLPASFSFCLTLLMAARYKRGQCHKQSLFIDERC